MTLRESALCIPVGSAPRTEILAVALLGPRCGPYTNRASSFGVRDEGVTAKARRSEGHEEACEVRESLRRYSRESDSGDKLFGRSRLNDWRRYHEDAKTRRRKEMHWISLRLRVFAPLRLGCGRSPR